MSVWKTFQAGWQTVREKSSRPESDERRDPIARDEWKAAARRSETIAAALLGVLIVAHAVLAGSLVSKAYIDIGDGNYMYTSSRMADGLKIYRDFLSPQPPMHLVVGSILVRIGRLFENGLYEIPATLIAFRVFSIALRSLVMVMVFLVGRRLIQTPYGGLVAAAIYAVLPIGFWWSLPYESEPLEILLLLASFWLFLPFAPRRMAISGVAMALAVLTNMTAAPYAVATLLYLAVRHRWRLFLHFLVPFAAILVLVAGYYEIRTGAYFRNVFFNQVGAFPPKEMLFSYVCMKIATQGGKILFREGGYILLALLGLVLYNRTDTRAEREYTVWYALALLCSILYVAKGGTADYIFTIGEPAVALFASYFVCQFFYPTTFRRFFRQNVLADTSAVPHAIFVLLILVVVSFPGFSLVRAIAAQQKSEEGPFEQTAADTARIEETILYHSKPGDRILADPYYAFLTKRLLVEEYSELFLWSLKYQTERRDGRPGEAVAKAGRIAQELQARRVPIVVANVSEANLQTFAAPEIAQAVEKFYKPLFEEGKEPKTMSFTMGVFVPKTDKELGAKP